MKSDKDKYKALKTELENTNRLHHHSVKVKELQRLSKTLSGKQLEIELNYIPEWEQLKK